MQNYNPTPADTRNEKLSDELMQLVEEIAENTHDVWAASRIKDGWTYGPVRNDSIKQHPCLVPYSELPESEKEYDRNTSIETLKLIQKLGWIIEKK